MQLNRDQMVMHIDSPAGKMVAAFSKDSLQPTGPPVKTPPNEPRKPPVEEPGEPYEKPPIPEIPPVEEPRDVPPESPVKEPPPEHPDQPLPQTPRIRLMHRRLTNTAETPWPQGGNKGYGVV